MDPPQVDFGRVGVNDFSSSEAVPLANGGGQQLEIQIIRTSDDSAVAFCLYQVEAEFSLVLSAGESEVVRVYFSPPSSDHFAGSIEAVTAVGQYLVRLGGCSTHVGCVVEF